MASGRPTFDAESLVKPDNHGKKWYERPHTEDALHDLVLEHKYDFNLGYLSNLRLFESKIQHHFGTAVLESPTYRDLMWRYETEENDAFSSAQYKAYNDFEHFLRDNIQGKVENHFTTLPPDERRLITAKILRLVRCAPAGTIETDTIRGISFTETAESEQFSLDKTPRTGEASSLKKLRVLILKDALEGPERAAYTAADQATAAAGEGEGVGPGRRSADATQGLSGLFAIDGKESPAELNTAPGITAFLNQIYHNLNSGSPGNAVDKLIDYYEKVIKGPIKKFTSDEFATREAFEKTYCAESGMEAIWLAKSKPKGLLAKTEGWENNSCLLDPTRSVPAHRFIALPKCEQVCWAAACVAFTATAARLLAHHATGRLHQSGGRPAQAKSRRTPPAPRCQAPQHRSKTR